MKGNNLGLYLTQNDWWSRSGWQGVNTDWQSI